jgi:multicomponent Na+:H+ antiporter subunit A
MTAVTLVLVAPCSLLLGAVLQLLIARLFSAKTKGILAVLSSLPSLLAVIATAPKVFSGQAIDLTLRQWDGPLAIAVHVDSLSILFAIMGTCIGGLVLLYSVGYMAHDKSATRFYATMLVFIGGFIGLVYSANLFLLYGCWELVGLCSFSLVGFWYTNQEAVNGARKVLLMTHIAGYGLLVAILVIYHRTGSALWTDPKVAQAFTSGVFVLMLVALVAKSVQFPLHTWIPEAMSAPTPVSALLHAACYVKAGVYLIARMHSFGVWPPAWSATVVWIGTATMAIGVMYAMVQSDLKRMLAYSTVSQIGYMMLGLGIGTPLAITAGLLHCLNHGFFKGGLFLTAGSVQHAAGTRDMNQLGGLASRMPQTTLSWLIGVGSMMGIPLMSGFASKWMLYAAALQSGAVIPAMTAWAASLGTVFIGVKATSAVFLGPPTEHTTDAHESPASMIWGMGLLAAGSIVLGVAPQLAVNYLLNPILRALALGAGVHVTWLGLSSDAGSFSTTGGLVLALVSVIVGGAIYVLAYPYTHALSSDGEAHRPDASTARAVHSRHCRRARAPAFPRSLGGHRRQAHGIQNHVHDLLRDPREGDGRTPGNLRQSRQLRDEPHRRRESQHRRSCFNSRHGGGARKGNDPHHHPDLHHQQDRNFALRGHRRPYNRKGYISWRSRSGGAFIRRRPGPPQRFSLRCVRGNEL